MGSTPILQGAQAVALFWAMQSVGSLLGIVLLKLFDVKKILAVFLIAQLIALSLALFGAPHVSLVSFVVCGFFNFCYVWKRIFSWNEFSEISSRFSFSGIFCTGIIGGAYCALVSLEP